MNVQEPKMKRQRTITGFFTSKRQHTEDQETSPPVITTKNHTFQPPPVPLPSNDTVQPSTVTGGTSTKHRYGYHRAWTKEFPWLQVIDDGNGLLCSLCVRHRTRNARNGQTVWAEKPCTCLQKDVLRRHEKSEMHSRAVLMEQERVTASSTGGIVNALSTQVSFTRKALLAAMDALYYLAKSEIAHTTNFEELVGLMHRRGEAYMRTLKVGSNAVYNSEMIQQEWLATFSELIWEEQMAEIKSTPFLSLMADESTDVANVKELALALRYLCPDGKLRNVILEMTPIEDGSADTILQAIREVLQSKDIGLNQVSAFSSDGASVFTGRHSGVATRLRGYNPNMVTIHCINHREALAIVDAAKHVPYIRNTFKPTMRHLYRYFDSSATREAGLHQIQGMLPEKNLKLKDACDTRWLSSDSACQTLHRCFSSVLVALGREASEKGESQAIGLHRVMSSYKFAATLYLFCDVLPVLSMMSRVFQARDVDVSMIRPQLQATTTRLTTLKSNKGKWETNLSADLNASLKDIISMSGGNDESEQFQTCIRMPFLDALMNALASRFPEIDLIEAFSLFNPHQDVSNFNKNVEVLGQRLSCPPTPVVSQEELAEEGAVFVRQLSTMKMTASDVARQLATDKTFQVVYPNLCKEVNLSLVLPVSTAEVERIFSTMKRIKTSLRNRMKGSTLNHLMRISMDGPSPEEFPFEKAVDKWGRKKKSRVRLKTDF